MNVRVDNMDEATVRTIASETINNMLRRLTNVRSWSTGAFARTAYGEPVSPMDRTAARWDVVGAMIADTQDLPQPLGISVRALIRRTLMSDHDVVSFVPKSALNRPGSDNLSVINDRITFPELTDWLSAALNRLS